MDNPTVSAATTVLERLQQEIREGLAGQPAELLGWRPYPAANTIAGMMEHMLDTSHYQLRVGLGRIRFQDLPPIDGIVAAQFATSFDSIDALLRRVDDGFASLKATVRDFTPEALAAERPVGNITLTGGFLLLHVCAHLREHWGQIQVTRDTFAARDAAGV